MGRAPVLEENHLEKFRQAENKSKFACPDVLKNLPLLTVPRQAARLNRVP
jgi:hypothetical protein